jgi:hypothetical protein
MPELYRTSVEAAVGQGDFNLVIDKPKAHEPTFHLVYVFMKDMGIPEADIERILGRSERIALVLDGEHRRIALSGKFPAALIRMGTKESRKEGAPFRIEVPYSGMVLVSSGDHRWMQRGWSEVPEEPFLLSSPAPGSIIFTLSDPAVLYRIDREGYFLKMAEYNALLSVKGAALPLSEERDGAWKIEAEMIASNEDGSRRIASVMKTALFSMARPKDDKPITLSLSEISGELLKMRGVERFGVKVRLGPVPIKEEALLLLLDSFKEIP